MRAMILCFLLAFGPVTAWANETYDMIFKTGSLSEITPDQVLHYDRALILAADPAYAARNTGTVRLSFEEDEMARLTFAQDEKSRNLGAFPATVGNPIIMYFVETVLRDVAQQAGGSSFYIRNRIKEALLQPTEIETVQVQIDGAEIDARRITLRPFENDKNRARMKGYGDLSLVFTMSENAPGWYSTLEAHVPDDIYSYALTLTSAQVAP